MKKLKFKEFSGKSGIYKIRSTIDKRIYIGSAKDLYDRIKRHINQLKSGTHHNCLLQRFWNKYGQHSLAVEVMEFCEKDKLIEKEQFWIDSTKCLQPIGFNIVPIVNGGFPFNHSEETKAKISKANKGKPSPMTGKTHTKEVKQRMSKSKKLLNFKPPNRVKVRLIKINGDIETFDSLSDGALKYDIQVSTIHNNLKGLSKTTKQGIWEKVV